jgi:hypothetical protein
MTAFEVPRERIYGNFRVRKPKEKQASQEQKREKEAPGHLTKVRKLPCCVCGEPAPSHAHHLKSAAPRGVGQKVPNRWTVPLCHECHIYGIEKVGSTKEASWFRERGILCLDLAAALWANSHSQEAMEKIIRDQLAAGRCNDVKER